MTFELPRKRNETFNHNYYYNNYNIYLLNLVERMIKHNPKERPSAKSAYDELIKIERSIKNLENIGNQLSDFEEVENKEKNKKFKIIKTPFRNGYVEQMRSKKDNLYYAIKKYDIKDTFSDLEITKRFKREIQILLDLEHENIIKFYGIFKDKENKGKFQEITKKNKINDVEIYCVVLEYVKSNLDKYMFHSNKELNSTPSESFVFNIFKQLLNGLIYLKNKNVLHRNIKPSNILLDDNNNLKISNFRLSAFINEQNSENQNKDKDLYFNNSIVGEPDIVSPEIKKKMKYDYSCDIYSLGLTILCLISTDYPIKYNNDNSERYIDTQYINNGYNDYLKKLVIKMINDDPNSRPNVKEVYDELLSIEASINNNINANTQIIKKNSDVGEMKSTSLIRVFQCLNDSIKENFKKIKSKIEFTSVNSAYKKKIDFISLDIINLMMQINIKDSENFNRNEFNNSIFNLRKKLSVKVKDFTGTEEVDPKIVIRELFQKVNSEFQNNRIFWVNPIFNNLRELKDFPRDTFPEIYEKINEFKDFHSPFINKFYFILLDLIKCPNCFNLIDRITNITYCLNISNSLEGKISKLINQSEDNSNKTYECKKCNYKGKGKKEIAFINTPEYLIIYFEGEEVKEKSLDSLLELGPYKISETGPELYNLYAFISKEEDGKYFAYIKNGNSWDLCSNNYNSDKVRVESFNYCFPSIAFYRSIDK
jgi:serine/threonine protein kinase